MFSGSFLAGLVFGLWALYAVVAAWESPGNRELIQRLVRQWLQRTLLEKLAVVVIVGILIIYAGTKPPVPDSQSSPYIVMLDNDWLASGSGINVEDAPMSSETPTLTRNQMVNGYALTQVTTGMASWLSTPENYTILSNWLDYGVHDDVQYIVANPQFDIHYSTNIASALFVASSGTLAFDSVKGTPLVSANGLPDGSHIPYAAVLHGPLSAIPPASKLWHSVSPTNFCMTWENFYAGRDTNNPVSFQMEVLANQDIVYRYLLGSNTVNSQVLTNFLVGLQANCPDGGEFLRFNSTNTTPQNFALYWTYFGYLDPAFDHHDEDTLTSSYEVYVSRTNPHVPDTDFDGLWDDAEVAAGSDPNCRDTDGDGLVDGSDPNPTSADTADVDADGILDAWELFFFGTLDALSDLSADFSTSGASDGIAMLTGIDPVFSVCVVTTSHGGHRLSWTDLADATNYIAMITCGSTTNWICATNICSLAITGDFTAAQHTLSVTAHCASNRLTHTASQTFRQPTEPNLTVWKISDPFALESAAADTTVLERSFTINRVREWQQYYITADYQSGAAWELDGIALHWSDSTSAEGRANASPQDSLLLESGADAQTLTVQLSTTRAGMVKSTQPLYLIEWSPAVTIDASAAMFDEGDGMTMVLISERNNTPTDTGFTVNTLGRPSNIALTADQRELLNDPFGDSGSSFSRRVDATGLISGGAFDAGESGSTTVTAPGGAVAGAGADGGEGGAVQDHPGAAGQGAFTLWRIAPTILDFDGYSYSGFGGHFERIDPGSDQYPFDTACLRKRLLYAYHYPTNDYQGGNDAGGVEVSLGLAQEEEQRFTVTINAVEGATYSWQEADKRANATVAFGTNQVWIGSRERVDMTDRDGGYWGDGPPVDLTVEDDACGCDDGCASGDCSDNDGPDLGSLKFRLSLGQSGYQQSSGFLWFKTDAMPAAITPELFIVTALPSVNVTSNNNALGSVDNVAVNGRRIDVSTITGGVRFNIYRYDNLTNTYAEGSWEVTSSGSSVTFIGKDSNGTPLRHLQYSNATVDGAETWSEADILTGAVKSLKKTDSGSSLETRDAESNLYLLITNSVTTIGTGTTAVERVSSRSEYGRYGPECRETKFYYHQDNLNPRVNGKLKLQTNDDGSWEYYLWDESGRERLQITSVEGSALPAFLGASQPSFNFNPGGSYPDLSAKITQYTYTTHAGDSATWHDAAQPRTVTEWRASNGAPVLTARTWHVYTRGETEIFTQTCSIITHTAIRAATQDSAINDPDNRVSTDTSFLDRYCGNLHLDGRPLYRKDEDGTTTTWEYDFDTYKENDVLVVVAFTGTTASPQGVSGKSTYEVEITDLYYGHILSRETMLYFDVEADVLLGSEQSFYDDKGRLLSTEYSDGTVMMNIWDCCHLTQTIARDGTVIDYSTPPGFPLVNITKNVSIGALPGANGRYPVNGTVVDLLGRVTNSYSSAGGVTQRTVTEYPEHSSHLRVTIDPLGVVTTNRTLLVWDTATAKYYITEEIAGAGITTTARRLANGEPVSTRSWVDPVSGESLVRAEKSVTQILEDGSEKRTSCVKYGEGEWITQSETVSDFLGRTVSSSRAGVGGVMLTTSSAYDNTGLLVQTISHDGSSMVYAYNELNERTATIRVAAGQTLDFDPHGFIITDVIEIDKYLINLTAERTEDTEGEWWKCVASVSYRPGENALTTSVQRVQLTGLTLECNSRMVSTDADDNTTVNTESLNPDNATKTAVSVDTTLGMTNITHFVAGYGTVSTNSLGSVTEHLYDGFARRVKTTNWADGRELKSVMSYHDDGSVATVGEVTSSGTNTISYLVRQPVTDEPDAYKITVTDPQGHQTLDYYSGDGELYRSEGATYPVAYAKNSAGQMEQLHTWRDESGNPDITRWHYDPFTGAVTNKIYADGKGTAYTHLSDGRIATRLWARNITTTYGYIDTANGSIQTTEYNDETPRVTNTFNIAGQLLSVLDGTGATTFGYDAKGRQIAETNALATITRSYDRFGRYTQCALAPVYPGYPCLIINYNYDIFNRLETVTVIIGSETSTFTYSYIPGTRLISGYTALTTSTPSTILTVSKIYEANRNLITAITNSVGSMPSVVSAFTYSNDSTGKRTARADYYNGSTTANTFSFNARGETTNAVMNSSTYSYDFDDIGNRTTSSVNSVFSTYTANQLNQYTSVNSAGTARSLNHDLDGNLTFDGTEWHHSYNGENRLISSSNEVTGVYITYAYDYQNRRTSMATLTPDPFSILTSKYIWDGWNIAAEIVIDEVTAATNIIYYTWGLDLSGTLQGAGGVGGLLSETKILDSSTNTYYSLSDANGNITEYLDNTGAVKAHYEYNACGEITALSGTMKDDFTHRFSTKPYDSETRLVQYEQRPYGPDLSRWLSRDPIGITGGLSEVGFVGNDAVNRIDLIGLWTQPERKKKPWASVCAQKKDTWQTLANSLGLDLAEASKWVKNYEVTPKAGKSYQIPNTAVIYLAKPEYFFPKKINPNDPLGLSNINISLDVPLLFDGADMMRASADLKRSLLEGAGYKIFKIESNDKIKLINSWRTNGIWGFVYGGHGSCGDLVTSQERLESVSSSEVSPPYKLGLIELYACESLAGKRGWKKHLGPNGMIVTMKGAVRVFNASRRIDIERGCYHREPKSGN